jgi:crotonobetainyl-CoA:carnitine CoA-transferase CaiB-like acyl-CoA transferase
VTTALFDTALAWTVYQLYQYMAAGEVARPQGSGTAMIAPYEAFPTADAWVMIAAGSDALFTKVCEALGAPALARDERFRSNPSRVEHRSALVEALSARTRTLTSTALLARLQQAGVPSAPILTADRVLAEPQTEASGMLLPVKHPRLGDYRAVGLPIRWDGERPLTGRVPPLLGEHSAEVLGELGYDPDTIRRLAERHVIGL